MISALLLRNGLIKMRRRPAVWVGALAYFAIVSLALADLHRRSVRPRDPTPFQLPESWAGMLEEPLRAAMFTVAALMVLLVGSEFTWRTARQSVIDGLGKEQFFAGNLLLLAVLAVGALAVPFVLGPIAVSISGGIPAGAWLTAAQLRQAVTGLLAILLLGSAGQLLALTVRGTGSALALLSLYLVFVERFLGLLMVSISPNLGRALAYLPLEVCRQLTEFGEPTALGTAPLIAAAIAYITILWALGILSLRRRDL